MKGDLRMHRKSEQRRRGPSGIFSFVGLLALGPVLAGCDAGPRLVHGSEPEKPVSDRGPQTVGIREVWRTNIASGFDNVGGMAAWPDGTIWVGDSRNLELWELRPDGSQPRAITWANSESERVDWISRVSEPTTACSSYGATGASMWECEHDQGLLGTSSCQGSRLGGSRELRTAASS